MTGLEKACVLLVDDLPTNRLMLKAALAGDGYAFVEAGDGEQALAVVAGGGVDVIVTDHQMPGLTGMELLTELRRHFDADTLPVMVVSGEEDETSAGDFIAAGANDFVTKPYDFAVIAARVRTMAGYKKALDRLRTMEG